MSLGLNKLPLIKLTLPFCVGIVLSEYNCLSSLHIIAFLIFLTFFSLIWVILVPRLPFQNSMIIISIFLMMGLLHHHFSNPIKHKGHFSQYSNASFLVTSVIETKQLEGKTRALCKVEYVGYKADSIIKSHGLLMAYFKGLNQSEVQAGDRYNIAAEYIEETENTNPLVFNYKRFLQNRGIYHKIYLGTDDYHSLSSKDMNLWNRASISRTTCLEIFKHHLTNDQNLAVASAMILGQRNLLSDELYDAFTDTGAVHILAVSGLHVGIVSGLIALLLGFLNKNSKKTKVLKLVISLAGIWAFAFLTGGAAAVIRASTMFSLYFIGKALNSPPISLNILAAAALIMLIYDPAYLFQAGFQFSFLALIGIMYFYPHLIRQVTTKNKIIKWTWAMIATSIAAQALVSPLAISYFHKLPTYFWLTGIIAVPLAGFILSAGIATLASHLLLGEDFLLTKLIGSCLDNLLSFLNYCIFKVQELPYCSTDDLWLSSISIILIYIAFIAISLFLKFKKPIYLILTVLFLLFQSVNHGLENNRIRNKKSLFVYDIYNESLIQLYHQGVLTEFTPGIKNRKQVDYITANNKMYHRTLSKKQPSDLGIISQNSFHLIDGKLMLFYPDETIMDWTSSVPIDLVVLSKNSYHNIEKITENYTIQKIVLDGTFDSKKYALRKVASKFNIPIHLTSIDGALEYLI